MRIAVYIAAFFLLAAVALLLGILVVTATEVHMAHGSCVV